MPDEVARLISKEFPANFKLKCFTFFYQMNGKHVGYLDIHMKTTSGEIINLWRKNGHQGNNWYNAAVDLPAANSNFKVSFQVM